MTCQVALSYIFFFACLAAIQNVACNELSNIFLQKSVQSRRHNVTNTLKSAKLGNFAPKGRINDEHAQLIVKQFVTRLNHFSVDDLRTVEFNYYLKDDYFMSQNNPIFIYINDGTIFTTQFLRTGLMHDIARDVNAALITADLRYFRSNLPTEDASFPNLEFLTVEQSVADIALLIEAVKIALNSSESRIILWGTGHGASLATWAKREYPHLVDGVLSSSGIYYRELITHAPYESLSRTIREIGGDECAQTIENALDDFEYLTRANDWWYVFEALDLCNFVFSFYDEDMALASRGLIQIIHHYLDVHHFNGIRNLCDDIRVEKQENAFEAFARWLRHVFTDEICLDLDYVAREWEAQQENWEFIEEFAWGGPVNLAFPFDNRLQWYQQCNQIGLFPTTVNGITLFGRLIQQEFYFLFCTRIFRDDGYNYLALEDSIKALNDRFGARDPQVEQIIFTNGELDPYYSFGITEYSNDNSYVFNIPQYSKSADLFSETQYDSYALRETKQRIRSIVTEWVRNEKKSTNEDERRTQKPQ